MLAKPFRLPSYLIPEVMKKGRMIQTSLFTVKYLDFSRTALASRKDCPLNSQLAFLVSKKIDKRAAVRNLVKRRLSEAVRSLLTQIKPGLAVVILAKKEILKADYQNIKIVVARFIAPKIMVP